MPLEAVERHVRIEQRILVVESDDETQRQPRLGHGVDEPAAELLLAKRVAQRVHHGAGRRARPAGTSHSSLMPIANCSGCLPAAVGARRSSCFVRLPRTPSQKIVTLARMSTPGSNVGLLLAVPADAAVAGAHADHALAVHQHLLAGKPGEDVDALGLDLLRQPLAELLSEMM